MKLRKAVRSGTKYISQTPCQCKGIFLQMRKEKPYFCCMEHGVTEIPKERSGK